MECCRLRVKDIDFSRNHVVVRVGKANKDGHTTLPGALTLGDRKRCQTPFPSPDTEPRLYALGQTDRGRFLFLVFTIREKLIRVISARDMSRREKKEYERAESEAANSKNTEA